MFQRAKRYLFGRFSQIAHSDCSVKIRVHIIMFTLIIRLRNYKVANGPIKHG